MTPSDTNDTSRPPRGRRRTRRATTAPATGQPATDHQVTDDRVTEDLAAAVEEFADPPAGSTPKDRRKLFGRVVSSVGASRSTVRHRGVLGWMGSVLEALTPRLKIRDLDTLRRHHHGLTGEALADSLVAVASRSSALVGAAGGALAAVEFAAPPTLLSVPVQIAAETILVAAVEIKLIAELHEVYGVEVRGTARQRALVYLRAWASQRGVDPVRPGSLTAVLGAGARRELRQRLLTRLGRNLTTLGPFLTGAVAGGYLNRRGTKRMAESVRDDLRGRNLEPV